MRLYPGETQFIKSVSFFLKETKKKKKQVFSTTKILKGKKKRFTGHGQLYRKVAKLF